ncbi:MAG: hypothetical protein AAF609_13150 [Cyanobacteria bacterium P01_C01_bin.120]
MNFELMNIDLIDLIGDLAPEGDLTIAPAIDRNQNTWRDSPVIADYENFQQATINVLREREQTALQSLKQALSEMSSPQHMQEILFKAVCTLLDQEPEVSEWILRNHDYLEPELSLLKVAQYIVLHWLEKLGLKYSRDFDFSLEGHLIVFAPSNLLALLTAMPEGDRRLVETILLPQ